MSKKPEENNNVEKVFEKRRQGSMEVITKILIVLAGVGCIGCIAYGVNTYNNAKEAETMQAAQAVQIEMNDSTVKTEVEEVVDNTIKQVDYNKEAKELWSKYGSKFICDENTFTTKYVNYRQGGLTAKESLEALIKEYEKREEIVEETVEEVAEEVALGYIVEEQAEQVMYATDVVNKRQGPNAKDFAEVGTLHVNEEVTVNGIVKTYKEETCLWYRLSTGEFVNGAYLSFEPVVIKEKPAPVEPQVTDPTPENSTTPINPNTGAPLQPGETFDDGWGGDGAIYIGDTTGQF